MERSPARRYVQYLIPSEVRHELPIVLVHGGSGQMLHYMGAGGGASGWAHYYAQAGYKVYLVDRAGHGRCVYHPDALGAINAQPTYEQLLPDFQRSARGPNKQWPGTGEMGDPLVDQFMASQNATPQDGELARKLWASHGAALLDRIGAAVIQTHSAGGPFGWVVANERPSLVKAVMCFEGGGAPLVDGKLTNLRGIPMRTSPPRIDARAGTGDRRRRQQGRRRCRACVSEGPRPAGQRPLRDVREQSAAGVRRVPSVARRPPALSQSASCPSRTNQDSLKRTAASPASVVRTTSPA
jgi:pimeloyl-ACP methyl ester carboxylesterase